MGWNKGEDQLEEIARLMGKDYKLLYMYYDYKSDLEMADHGLN